MPKDRSIIWDFLTALDPVPEMPDPPHRKDTDSPDDNKGQKPQEAAMESKAS